MNFLDFFIIGFIVTAGGVVALVFGMLFIWTFLGLIFGWDALEWLEGVDT